MEIELWWLLVVPLFFGLGWIAARVDIRHLVSQSRSLPTSYFRGLGFLLNEEPDKAIDAFIEAVQHDPDTTELHFALGNLFRRRGEFERAVRVHQHLLGRADLSTAERDRAQHELAQDFMKAGLFDRAQHAFEALEGTVFDTDVYAGFEKDVQEIIDTFPGYFDVYEGLLTQNITRNLVLQLTEAARPVLRGEVKLELVEIKPEPRTSGKTAEQMMAAEAQRLEAAIPKGARRVVLDERGSRVTTVQLAERLKAWQLDGRDVACQYDELAPNTRIYRKRYEAPEKKTVR